MLTVITILITFLFSYSQQELREYCWEPFKASCHPDYHYHLPQKSHNSTHQTHSGRVIETNVVLITQAYYGRMKRKQCIKGDYEIGCHRDVLSYVDRLCSGRTSCEIGIPHAEMHKMQPCSEDLVAYLEAEFSCVRVLKASEMTSCAQNDHPIYLSNSAVFLRDHHAYKCSFTLSAKKGQRINITLFDFNISISPSPSSDDLSSNSNPSYETSKNSCNPELIYAVLKNPKINKDDSKVGERDKKDCEKDEDCDEGISVVCGGRKRESHLLLSSSHQVYINLINQQLQDHSFSNNKKHKKTGNEFQPRFMLLLEAVGCADPVPPLNGWIDRIGFDKVTVHCNHTIEKWYLVCNQNAWVGHYKNCATLAEISSEDSLVQASSPYHVGIFVAVTIGIALGVFCGLLLLSMVICCQKNKNNNHYRNYVPGENRTPESGKTNKSQLVMADKFYYDLSNHPSYRVQAGICSCVVQNPEMSLQKQTPTYDPCLALKQLQPITNDHALNLDFCLPTIGRQDTTKNSSTACQPYLCEQQNQLNDCEDYDGNKLDKFNSVENLGFSTKFNTNNSKVNNNNMNIHEINS